MRKIITLLTVLLVSSLVMGQNQERLSVHFFDVPQNLESEFLKFNSEVNKTLENDKPKCMMLEKKFVYKLYRV